MQQASKSLKNIGLNPEQTQTPSPDSIQRWEPKQAQFHAHQLRQEQGDGEKSTPNLLSQQAKKDGERTAQHPLIEAHPRTQDKKSGYFRPYSYLSMQVIWHIKFEDTAFNTEH